MFSNLSIGSVLHGVDWRGDMKWFTGKVDKVVPSMNKQYYNVFGQVPSLTFDITVDIDGEQKQFQQVPGNDTIADFGKGAFIISDNKDSLYNYIKSQLKKSEDIIAGRDEHLLRIPQYKNVLAEMRPDLSNSNEVKELKEQVSSLQSQLAETLALLKGEKEKK